MDDLKILEVLGESPAAYYFLESDYHNKSSLWNLWMYDVVPNVLYKLNDSGKLKNDPQHILGTSFFNSDVPKGLVYVNDLYVTVPYKTEWFYSYPAVSGKDLKNIYCKMVNGCNATVFGSPTGFLKYFITELETLKPEKLYSVILTDYDSSRFESKAKSLGINV